MIDGEYWTGPERIVVDPQSNKSYEIAYKPLTMTAEGKKHSGSIFFPLPDGSGLLYNLQGTAEAPKVSAKISREIPCKTPYVEMLNVTNWLSKPQRYMLVTVRQLCVEDHALFKFA